MADRLGVAVVGTGFGQKVHIPAFQEHPHTQVVAVYHRDLEQASAIAQAHQIPYACDDLTELVTLPDVQAVSIATPPFLHYPMAEKVLQANKHLLLEKPMTLTASEARDLSRLATQRGVVGVMDFEFRYVPAWQRLAALLSEGYVGTIRLVKIDWLGASRAQAQRPWNWYAQQELGGGALGALGSHTFDYLHWLWGPVQRLWGQLGITIPQRPDPKTGTLKPVDADDTCHLVLELANGIPCQICISSVTHQGRGHWLEVYGDRGSLILGNSSQTDYIYGFHLWATPPNDLTTLVELPIPQAQSFENRHRDGRITAFLGVVDAWIADIRQGSSQAPSLMDGVYSQLLMDLTHQSHLTGTWMEVPVLADYMNR